MSPTPALDRRFEISPAQWALWIAAFLVFLIVLSGRVRYTEGDSRYALLASMALLEHGSLQLDAYDQALSLEKLNNGHYWMMYYAPTVKHLYYDYPVGTPIFSMPFVWAGRMLGMNPLQREDDTSMQIGISAILCSLIFLLLFRLSRLYLGEWAALLFSLAIFLGSAMISTMGTALWSQSFQTLFVVLILYELAAFERGKLPKVRGIWLGSLLFAAYLCRPTSSALILAVFGYLALRDRRSLPWVAGAAAALLAAFVLWSWLEMRMLLPRYYDPTMWRSTDSFWDHILPLLFGPARGLWAFTPALLLVFVGWAFRSVRTQPLFWMFWLWLIVQTLMLARSQSPWGGWSFGPRFFTELTPGMALVLLMLSTELEEANIALRKGLLGFFVVASAFGIYVHSLQGLNNIETIAWNDNPNIDQHWKERRWDWRHPQFLASAHQRLDMIAERSLRLQVSQALRRIPAQANLRFGEPDPLLRDCFARWNASNAFGAQQKLYNSSRAMADADVHEFYFPIALLPEVKNLPQVQIDSSQGYRLCLGEFLQANAAQEIVVVAKDDCSTGPALETRAYLRSIGSLLDSVKLRDSYVLHLKAGKVLYEEFGPRRIDYVLPGKPSVKLSSAGLFVGNSASIVVDGQECSLNQRGMNVVVLDEARRIIWSTSFDTHGDDHEQMTLMKAKY